MEMYRQLNNYKSKREQPQLYTRQLVQIGQIGKRMTPYDKSIFSSECSAREQAETRSVIEVPGNEMLLEDGVDNMRIDTQVSPRREVKFKTNNAKSLFGVPTVNDSSPQQSSVTNIKMGNSKSFKRNTKPA